MTPPKPRAPPALPDDIIEAVLLRVPPDDPASLVRAAVACRRWCRLVSDQDFRRRRLKLHGATPPMLGFLCDGIGEDKEPSACFVPTSSCRPPRADHYGLRPFDARHGRVVFHNSTDSEFVVWDPITDQRVELPPPPSCLERQDMKATVLCAATNSCDHLDCHSGPFIVVLVGTQNDIIDLDIPENGDFVGGDDRGIYLDGDRWCQRVPKDMFSCIYSSESGSWSKPTYADHPGDNFAWARSALVGNALFFVLYSSDDRILRYDLGTEQMSVIRLPYVHTIINRYDIVRTELTTLEDGRLGIVRVEQSSKLCLWSRGVDNVEQWTLCEVIDLKVLFPLVDSFDLKRCLVGFAENVCAAFVSVKGGTFTIDMRSGLMKKVYEGRNIYCAIPYINFCTPALEAPTTDDQKGVGTQVAREGVSSV